MYGAIYSSCDIADAKVQNAVHEVYVFRNTHEPPIKTNRVSKRFVKSCDGCILTVHHHILSGHRFVCNQHSDDDCGILSAYQIELLTTWYIFTYLYCDQTLEFVAIRLRKLFLLVELQTPVC